MPQERYAADMRIKENALDIEARFFMHWTLLSGGTFTLLVPLLQSLDRPLCNTLLLRIGEVLLLSTLLTAAVGFYAVKQYSRERSFHGDPETRYSRIKYWAAFAVLFLYGVGLIAVALFIDSNIVK